MGKQSARMWFDEHDHKDIYFDGHYHQQMYLSDENANLTLLWEKLAEAAFKLRVMDNMLYVNGTVANSTGYVALSISGNGMIDWGDGTKESFDVYKGGYLSHTYPTSNQTEYDVEITGELTSFNVAVNYSTSCITEVLTPIPKSVLENCVDGEFIIITNMLSSGGCLRSVCNALFCNGAEIGYPIYGTTVFSKSAIESIPAFLFDGCKDVRIGNIFTQCDKLKTIETDAFANATYSWVSYLFANCTALKEIYDFPKSGTTSASEHFTGCTSLETVDFIFTGIVDFTEAFINCRTLKDIPNYLFAGSTQATSFNKCFSGCYALEQIPEGLFEFNSNAISFKQCFYGCTSLKKVPQNLFSRCQNAESFYQCFNSCSALETVEEGVFDNCISVLDMQGVFLNCRNLTDIPDTLFDDCFNVENMSWIFGNCASLTYVSQNIFDNNLAVTDFSYAFYQDSAISSALPELWTRTNVSNYYYCFYGCTNAQNYGSVPSGWR